MEIVSLANIPRNSKTVMCIGVFDGVHVGHREIISRAVGLAAQAGSQSVVLTFEPHPEEVFSDREVLRLSNADIKAQLIKKARPDFLVRLKFDADMASLEPEQFVDLLTENMDIQTIVIGANFHFGRKASGNTGTLDNLGKKYGFAVEVVPLLEVDGLPVSSTRIKETLAKGDIELAERLLGRKPFVSGRVIKGSGRGKKLGFPTINIEPENPASVPMDGVYGGYIRVNGDRLSEDSRGIPCAISIGNQPTFSGKKRSMEAHIIDFDEDIYGDDVIIDFDYFLRNQKKFSSVDELVSQIQHDIHQITQKLQA